jgi:hypothetical protein
MIKESMDSGEEKVFIPEVVGVDEQAGGPSEEKKSKARVGCAVAGISYFLMIALGFIIYVWTIVIAYKSAGLLGAFLSLIFPVFAQVFWGLQLWMDSTTLMNPYCLTLLGYILATVLARLGLLLFQKNIIRSSRQ